MNGEDHLLTGVYAIFFSEIVTVNLMQLIDFGGNFRRHVLAPRAQTQEDLNQCMSGSVVELAERYTVSTRIFECISSFMKASILISFPIFHTEYDQGLVFDALVLSDIPSGSFSLLVCFGCGFVCR